MKTDVLVYPDITGCSKGELAMAYFPHSSCPKAALRNLARWLDMNKALMEQLLLHGYQRRQRLLTPRQVSIIYEFLGRP